GLDAISLPLVATTNAHYARPADRRLADTHAALRAGVPLAEADPYLGSRPAHLRSGEEMMQLLPRYPGAIAQAARLGRDCAVDLPPVPGPAGPAEASWLVELGESAGRERDGPRPTAERPEQVPGAWAQIAHALEAMTGLPLRGYSRNGRAVVAFSAWEGILAQG